MTSNSIALKQAEAASKQADASVQNAETNRRKLGVESANVGAQFVKALNPFRINKNDPEWYKQVPGVDSVTSNLSYNLPMGTPLDKFANGSAVPGLLVYRYIPSLGGLDHVADHYPMGATTVPGEYVDQFSSSAFNTAVKNMYAYVRYANSGARNYEAPDMGLMLACAIDIVVHIAQVYRILQLAQKYPFLNKYFADGAINALGFKAADVRANFNNYLSRLNLLILQTAVIRVPNDIKLFNRRLWLSANLFKDDAADTDKMQYVLFSQSTIYHYVEKNNMAKAVKIGWESTTWETYDLSPIEVNVAAGLTLGEYMDIIESAIASLRDSESFNIMMGDILKAYGEDRLYKLTTFSSVEPIIPCYDNEVVAQLTNANIASYCTLFKEPNSSKLYTAVVRMANGLDIWQDNRQGAENHGILYEVAAYGEHDAWAVLNKGVLLGVHQITNATERDLIYNETVTKTVDRMYSWQRMGKQQVLTSYDAVPSGDTVLESTRLVHTLSWAPNIEPATASMAMYSTSHGTEIINDARVYYFNKSNKLWEFVVFGNTIELSVKSHDDTQNDSSIDPIYAYRPIMTNLAYLESLFLKPRFHIWKLYIDNVLEVFYASGALSNYIPITEAELQKINAPVIYSLWLVPGATGIQSASHISTSNGPKRAPHKSHSSRTYRDKRVGNSASKKQSGRGSDAK